MPNNLPNRKKLRYENFDYSENGYYFVTILTKNRENFFGKIKNGEVVLSEIGKMAHTFFQEIPLHFPDCQVDEFIIMPNHIHGIIIIDNGEVFVRNADLRSLPTDKTKMLLSKVVHWLKSSVTREIRKTFPHAHFWWHKSFHDTIIRTEKQLIATREYIVWNPAKWEEDENNPKNFKNITTS